MAAFLKDVPIHAIDLRASKAQRWSQVIAAPSHGEVHVWRRAH